MRCRFWGLLAMVATLAVSLAQIPGEALALRPDAAASEVAEILNNQHHGAQTSVEVNGAQTSVEVNAERLLSESSGLMTRRRRRRHRRGNGDRKSRRGGRREARVKITELKRESCPCNG